MRRVREAFERARVSPDEIDRAIDTVMAFLDANEDDPVALAYCGSLHAMKAGASRFPWDKLRNANIATGLLDRAYARRHEAGAEAKTRDHPADLEILLLRGIAYASFPAFLGRENDARTSLEEAIGHRRFAAVPPVYRALVYAHMAVLCHRSRDERRSRTFLESALVEDRPAAQLVWGSL